ncbi:unnamed protein product [Adineta steineri]|uniref:Apple domain-containing protein n=1 Tax=Adineta steineri TaxID=433720 RepID=A0A819KYB3_9BILA|nr:unnamed protein product [Adineta steineri]CAF3952211.1 unnamed protein product [Adineta steineri]
MSTMNGWQVQCSNTSCLPFTTLIVSNSRRCQMACLAQIQCTVASFHQSNSNCQLFADLSNQNGNMLPNIEIITMIVISGTRIPSAPTTTSTTTTSTTTSSTSSTSTSTSTTSSSTSLTTTSASTSTSLTSSSTSTTATSSTTTSTSTTSKTTTTAICVAATYSQYFTVSVTPTSQCTAWFSFLAGLTCSTYSTIRIYGTNDPTGLSVIDSTVVNNLVSNLRNNA